MTSRSLAGIVFLLIAPGVAGCGDARSSSPSAPSPVSGSTPASSVVDGLFIKGTVFDTAFRPLVGARVEVVEGPEVGLSATVDARGEFSLTGTFDDTTRFRATKEGHAPDTKKLGPFCAACNPNRWVNFSLELLAPPVNIAGDYILTFEADSACASLPATARTRTFAATIPPLSSAGITVTGATVYKDWNVLGLGIAGDYVAFWLETLVEQIAPNTFLSFGGQAAASIGTSGASTFTLPFHGTIDYCVTKSETNRFEDCLQTQAALHSVCDSNNHRLILTRR